VFPVLMLSSLLTVFLLVVGITACAAFSHHRSTSAVEPLDGPLELPSADLPVTGSQ